MDNGRTLPQIYKNYSLKSTSGLSIYFLVEWCLGDATNLFGAILTRQASWQVVIAGYYVFVDAVLVSQYVWYTHYEAATGRVRALFWGYGGKGSDDDERPLIRSAGEVIEGLSPTEDDSDDQAPFPNRSKKNGVLPEPQGRGGNQMLDGFESPPSKERIYMPESRRASTKYTVKRVDSWPPGVVTPKTLLFVSLLCSLASAHPGFSTSADATTGEPTSSSSAESVGRILSWISTLLYLGSRLPQLYKNHTRRSTSGLSATLFIAAFFGNLFYSSSLLTNPCAWDSYEPHGGRGWVGPEGSDRRDWIERATPFWLGAAGVLLLDGAVGVQFLIFGEGPDKKIVKDKEGRWRRVSGWMRGWVPRARSNSPARDRAGEHRSLLEQSDASARSYGAV
ncbi:MAG: hypothetical protein M1833_000472 [Piccolia ochrophora]|nr:MAG: hypothetical protein M1833_000472 [Piccolia ochrophora]